MPENSQQVTQEKQKQKTSLALRVWKLHNTFVKLGPKIGGPVLKLTAFYCLYKIFSNGGIESLAYVSYEHMLNEGKAEAEKRGTQSRMRKNKRQ